MAGLRIAALVIALVGACAGRPDTGRGIVPSEAAGNWTEVDACIKGPFEGVVESQIRAMLASALADDF